MVSNEGQSERKELYTALTTNVTSFFREEHHFEYLRTEVFPELGQKAASGARIRIWCSACSSGQEAYCLAMTWLEACPDSAGRDVRILASDLDPNILAKAQAGEYDKSTTERIESRYKKYFEERPGNIVRPVKKVRDLIAFRQLNLVKDWPFKGKFDVIMCRNVAIYFDQDIQSVLWNRFADNMNTNGTLLIGHSERLCGPSVNRFESCGITTYSLQ